MAKRHARVLGRVGIRNRDTRSCLSFYLCPCNSLTGAHGKPHAHVLGRVPFKVTSHVLVAGRVLSSVTTMSHSRDTRLRHTPMSLLM